MKLLLPLLICYVVPHWVVLTAFLLIIGIYLLLQGVMLSLQEIFSRLNRKLPSLAISNVIHVDFQGGRGAREMRQR